MGRARGFTPREVRQLAAAVQNAGWKVKEQARANVYADFRRRGLELDPTRLARAS